MFEKDTTSFVIDCGTRDSKKAINFCNGLKKELTKIASHDLMISHYHFDHYSLVNKFPFFFFDNIYLPALPPQSRTADIMYQFLSVANILAFRNYYLAPIISNHGKKICPLVKGDSFNAINREWKVLWPDYNVVDKINRKKINKLQIEIGKIVEELRPDDREAFEQTYGRLSRTFSTKEKSEEQTLTISIPLEKETDNRFNDRLRKIEGNFRNLANRVSLVVRDESNDFLFTGDVDNTILDNYLNFEEEYFLVQAAHHGGYYGQAFNNVETNLLVISRAKRYKTRCEYYQELTWNKLIDTAMMGNSKITFLTKHKIIGILAYGSVINDPGKEIEQAEIDRIKVATPFKIEFARKSNARDDAPTLVPVENGGAKVKGQIFVMKDCISEKEATDILWRREIHQKGSGKEYKRPNLPNTKQVFIERIENFQNIDVVLFTYIASNINPLTPKNLAYLAIESAKKRAGDEKQDGISYLIDAKKQGIKTPLMKDYEKEILQKTLTTTLEDALQKIRKNGMKSI
ncbi:MAG: MBL fold metallo-hydrolase [Candidatus Bathyarchaeota archaeon]|nr:MAG: MBL fold metallo-hydrolase [Candidatus Bathyarchaeota archaeon]